MHNFLTLQGLFQKINSFRYEYFWKIHLIVFQVEIISKLNTRNLRKGFLSVLCGISNDIERIQINDK